MQAGLMRLMAEGERSFTVVGPMKSITIGDSFIISETIIVEWLIVAVLGIFFFVMGRNLKVSPTSRRQVIAEWIVGMFTGQVDDTMGPRYKGFAAYIGSLFCFVLLGCLMGIFGLRNPCADISVTASWAIITFFLVLINKFRTGGVKGYLKSFVDPMPFMLPFNIIGDFANPLSQALRLFGNNLSGMVIGGLVYFALGGFAAGLLSIGIPAVLSMYFDLFSGFIQSYIFTTLTMSYVAMAETD